LRGGLGADKKELAELWTTGVLWITAIRRVGVAGGWGEEAGTSGKQLVRDELEWLRGGEGECAGADRARAGEIVASRAGGRAEASAHAREANTHAREANTHAREASTHAREGEWPRS
jgi:hypothetical protein